MGSSEYGMAMVGALELIWGEGFLSPGGPEEVAAALDGRDIEGTEVLDIGCGIGGVDLLLIERFGAARVVGIDVEADNLALARNRAAEKGLAERVNYRLVEARPGPLRDRLAELVGEAETAREIGIWQCMIPVLDSGELRPTHLYGEKRS
jgi:phosphoethanolamine N-methyltransferase